MCTLQLIYNTVYNCFVLHLLRTTCFYLLKLYDKKIPLSLNYTSDEATKDFYERSTSECVSIFQEIIFKYI